jgi:hypothetical protein
VRLRLGRPRSYFPRPAKEESYDLATAQRAHCWPTYPANISALPDQTNKYARGLVQRGLAIFFMNGRPEDLRILDCPREVLA